MPPFVQFCWQHFTSQHAPVAVEDSNADCEQKGVKQKLPVRKVSLLAGRTQQMVPVPGGVPVNGPTGGQDVCNGLIKEEP